MRVRNLIIPMRAQPFHFGHQRLLTRVSEICKRGAVFLNTEQDTQRNPFPFRLRKSWIESFLLVRGIVNLSVAERNLAMKPEEKHVEYRSYFGEEDFFVLTTNETEVLFGSLGFRTINHHDPVVTRVFWSSEQEPHLLHNYGQIIRQRLLDGQSCSTFLDPIVEREAREYLLRLPG